MPKGIYNRKKCKPFPRRKFFHDKSWLIEQYLYKKRSTVDIAKEINSVPQVVNYWLRKNGIQLRDTRSASHMYWMLNKSLEKTTKYKISKEYLRKEYFIERKTINQIACEFGCSWDVVRKRLIKYNFPIKGKDKKGERKRTTSETRRFQKELLKLYGYKCAICKYDKFVNCHHIERFSVNQNNSRKNGIVLCPNHHAEADYGIISEKELRRFQVNKT